MTVPVATHRCSRCPHVGLLHRASGECFYTGCKCPGFEPDAGPDVLVDPTGIGFEPGVGPVTLRAMAKLDEEVTERVRNYLAVGAPLVTVRDKDLGEAPRKSDVLANSPAGDHYKGFAIEPIEYIEANQLPYHEAAVVKYVTRWRRKGGIEDLRKAKFYIERLIEITEQGGGDREAENR